MTPDDVTPAEFRLWALTDGWFAALDNLHDMPQEKRRSERRRRELSARVRGEPTELSVRLHKHGLYQNLFKEQRDWVQLGERIGLFPRGATTYLDEHFLLDRYVNWLDPGLRYGSNVYSPSLLDPDHFTRAYARAVSSLTAPQLGRIHLTHFASEDEWHLALAEVQVLRATATVYPQELATGITMNQYNLYWFIDSYESYEGERTPASWRDGSSWPGIKASMRLDVLRNEFSAFETEFHEALVSSLDEDASREYTTGRRRGRFKGGASSVFSERRLLTIGSDNEFDLKLMREQVIRLLRGRGRARVQ